MKTFRLPLILMFLLPLLIFAQIPDKPDPPRLVNDFSGILAENESVALEKKLSDFALQTSNQIVVVIINDLQGYDPADFAFRLGEKWGVGQKDKDNGIVLLIKPKTAVEGGKIFIAVGYGLEGIIPDAVTKRIIEHEFIPYFREGKMYEGIDKGTSVLMSLAQKEFSSNEYLKKTQPKGSGIFLLFGIIIFFVILRSFFSIRRYSSVNDIPFWLALMMMSNTGRGTYQNYRSGGGGFLGGGGGFGGFGGGSFGGGGAGGSL